MLQREVAGIPMVVPRWEHCLEDVYQVRKEAIWLTVEENFSIQAALWHTLEDQNHKLTRWVQLLTIANAQQAGPTYAKKVQSFARRCLSDLVPRHLHIWHFQRHRHIKEVEVKERMAKERKAPKAEKAKGLLRVLRLRTSVLSTR